MVGGRHPLPQSPGLLLPILWGLTPDGEGGRGEGGGGGREGWRPPSLGFVAMRGAMLSPLPEFWLSVGKVW